MSERVEKERGFFLAATAAGAVVGVLLGLLDSLAVVDRVAAYQNRFSAQAT